MMLCGGKSCTVAAVRFRSRACPCDSKRFDCNVYSRCAELGCLVRTRRIANAGCRLISRSLGRHDGHPPESETLGYAPLPGLHSGRISSIRGNDCRTNLRYTALRTCRGGSIITSLHTVPIRECGLHSDG